MLICKNLPKKIAYSFTLKVIKKAIPNEESLISWYSTYFLSFSKPRTIILIILKIFQIYSWQWLPILQFYAKSELLNNNKKRQKFKYLPGKQKIIERNDRKGNRKEENKNLITGKCSQNPS